MHRRGPVMGKRWLVASAHPLASYYGSLTLLNGGNVADAALVTSAVLSVVRNDQNGLGGDLFGLIKIGDKIYGINGSGRSGELATLELYKSKGLSKIPERGPLSAITVPGIVDAWRIIHKDLASMELKDLLLPAIDLAENGFPLTHSYVDSIRSSISALGNYRNWGKTFLVNGQAPMPGFMLKQRDLGNSLKAIAEEGPETFYRGALADKIIKGIEKEGGILTHEDFKSHQSFYQDPLYINYRGFKVYETAPNSQGAAALLWLKLIQELGSLPVDAGSLLREFCETYAYVDQKRSRYIGDPDLMPITDKFFSTDECMAEKRGRAAGNKNGDTTYFVVADSEGNFASIIQSNYMGFGSGLMPDGTGIVLNNRGSYFTLDESHHNSLAPRKRTFHTLSAALGISEDGTTFAIGSMGADLQPQIHVQLITDIVDLGMNVQEAIDMPRWGIPNTIYESPSTMIVEEGLAPYATDGLCGLKVSVVPELSSALGHAQGIILSAEGVISAGADLRTDGSVAGL